MAGGAWIYGMLMYNVAMCVCLSEERHSINACLASNASKLPLHVGDFGDFVDRLLVTVDVIVNKY